MSRKFASFCNLIKIYISDKGFRPKDLYTTPSHQENMFFDYEIVANSVESTPFRSGPNNQGTQFSGDDATGGRATGDVG
ncbi:hypothetical protein ACFL1G_11455 [Planctomycetota bacterium]